jgi:hypothetical protein
VSGVVKQITDRREPLSAEYQKRTGDRVMMYMIMRAGQNMDAKKAFYNKVVENLKRSPVVERQMS